MSESESAAAGGLQHWTNNHFKQPLLRIVGGRARLKVILILAAVLALDAADKATVGVVADQLKSSLHIDNVDVGWLVTASTAMGALMTLPFGALADRMSRSRLLVIAIALWSVAMIVGGASNSYTMLLVSRLLLGTVVAAALPAVTSLTGSFFHADERGRIFGYVLAGELIGVAIGFLMSGNVAALVSWRLAFWLLGALGFVLAVLVWRLLPEPARDGRSQIPEGARQVPGIGDPSSARAGDSSKNPPGDAPPGLIERQITRRGIEPHRDQVLDSSAATMSLWHAVRFVLSVRTFRTLVLASGLGYFYFTGIRTFVIVFMIERYGMAQHVASSVAVVIGLGSLAGVLIAGRSGDALLRRGRLNGRVVVGALAFLVATAAFAPGLFCASLWAAGPLFFIAAAGIGGANPAISAVRLDVMPSVLWGRAEGVYATVRFGLEAMAPPLFAYVAGLFSASAIRAGKAGTSADGHGLGMAFLVLLVPLAAAGLLLLLRTRRTYARDAATALATDKAIHAEPAQG